MSTQEDNSKIVDFEAAKQAKEQEVNKEELMREAKEQIEQNIYLQKIITIATGNSLYNVDENGNVVETHYDYNALLEDYKAEANKNKEKFVSLGEPDPRAIEYYYNLFQFGYRTFGAKFFTDWLNNENQETQNLFFIGLWGLVRGIENAYETLNEAENELRAYKSIKLTAKQKEDLTKELKKTPEEYLEELLKAKHEENKN